VLVWLKARSATPETISALQQKFSALHVSLQRDTSELASHAIEQVLQNQAR
jgi:lipid-A-disaccharide synthase